MEQGLALTLYSILAFFWINACVIIKRLWNFSEKEQEVLGLSMAYLGVGVMTYLLITGTL